MTDDNSSSTKPPHKAYGITNIKNYVPLILDLTTRNYEPWSDLFHAHCIAYGVADHIDSTYDPPNSTPPFDYKMGRTQPDRKTMAFRICISKTHYFYLLH